MQRIILFRYHKKPLICRERLAMLKQNNPGIKIYGLYGGSEKDFAKYEKYLSSYLEHNYCITGQDDRWKWKNSDLAIRLWYKDYGHELEFEMLNVIEWDLILFGNLDEVYKNIPTNGIGLTGLNKLSNIADRWSWTSREPYKNEWLELSEYVKKEYNYMEENYACVGPGVCLPKIFLEKFSSIKVPDLVHDELRFPLYGQIFGLKLFDTNFFRKWFDIEEKRFFNCNNMDINIQTIEEELKKKTGRRVFHPFRGRLNKGIIKTI